MPSNGQTNPWLIVYKACSHREQLATVRPLTRIAKVLREPGNGLCAVANDAFGNVAQPEIFPACADLDESWTPPRVSITLSKCHRSMPCLASGLVQIAKSLRDPNRE